MTRRTAPAVALGTLVGLVLGAVAYVTVSAGSPEPVPVARVVSDEPVAEPVVLGVSTSEEAAHQVRPVADDETSADPSDDVDPGDSGDVVTVPARDDDSDDADDSDRPSARPTADDDHDDDDDDSGHDDDDDEHDDDGDDDSDDDGDDD